jgi:hypothetical protein
MLILGCVLVAIGASFAITTITAILLSYSSGKPINPSSAAFVLCAMAFTSVGVGVTELSLFVIKDGLIQIGGKAYRCTEVKEQWVPVVPESAP